MSTLGPLLGLLGTVVGIIQSFDALGGRVGPARGEALAHGISLALVATAFGLAIAIIAVDVLLLLPQSSRCSGARAGRPHAAGHRAGLERVSPSAADGPASRPDRRGRRASSGVARDLTTARSVCRGPPRMPVHTAADPWSWRIAPMLASRLQADEPPVINMTPMVDVILCLLVFFMAATRLYDWDESEFVVNVPEVAEAAPATAAPDDLVLTVIKRGIVSVGDSTYNLDQLVTLLARRRRSTSIRAW